MVFIVFICYMLFARLHFLYAERKKLLKIDLGHYPMVKQYLDPEENPDDYFKTVAEASFFRLKITVSQVT